MNTDKLRELIAKWRKFADTDYTKGQKLGDARKQGQYELMMAGQSLAYATAAKELEAALAECEPPDYVDGEYFSANDVMKALKMGGVTLTTDIKHLAAPALFAASLNAILNQKRCEVAQPAKAKEGAK